MADTATLRAWRETETRLRTAIAAENHQEAMDVAAGAAAAWQRLALELPPEERPALLAEARELLTWAANCARVSRSIWAREMEQVGRLQQYNRAGRLPAPATMSVTL